MRDELLKKWKEIILNAENVASEVLRDPEADELTIQEKLWLLEWSGDDEYCTVDSNGDIINK